MSRAWTVAVLPGDGVGPEVTREACRVLAAVAVAGGFRLHFCEYTCGGAALERDGCPLPAATLEACRASDAVLFGAVGGPAWDDSPRQLRPEQAILGLRRGLGVFANLRPIRLHPALAAVSPLRPEVIGAGVDVLIVRELTGGLYYGEPRGRVARPEGGHEAYDTMRYSTAEVERVARVALAAARARRQRLVSVDKANVLECSRLWREVVTAVAREEPGVQLGHLYVDDCAARLVREPGSFDVLLTENTFGDILSDLGAVLAGSMGLLPSASLGADGPGLFEPAHGSAPDIAGQGRANPIAAVLSAALLLRYGLGQERAAAAVEGAVDRVLDEGYRTADLAAAGQRAASTSELGAAIAERVRECWEEGRGTPR